MPSVFVDKPASPYNIPVLGQEDAVHRDDRITSGGGGGGGYTPKSYFAGEDNGNYGLSDGDGGLDGLAPLFDIDDRQIDDIGNFDDGDDGAFDFAMSPFKYHRDVSNVGPRGDSLGYDDQVRS